MNILRYTSFIFGLLLVMTTSSFIQARQSTEHELLLIGNRDTSGGTFVYTMHPDGSGLDLISPQPFLTEGWLSPNDNWLYLRSRASPTVFLFSIQDKQLSNLTLIENLTVTPSEFSADGNYAFYRKHDAQTQIDSLWMMRLDGTEQQQLVTASNMFLYHAFSPDKKWFYFIDTERHPARLNLETFVVEPIGATGFLPDESMLMRWVNGEWIVYRDSEIGQPLIISRMRPDGTDVQVIATLAEAYDFFGFGWHDDEWVVLNRNNGTAHCIKLDGTDTHIIPNTGGVDINRQPTDGFYFYQFEEMFGPQALFHGTCDSEETTQITDYGWRLYSVTQTSDQQWIFYATYASDSSNSARSYHRIRPDGTEQMTLLDNGTFLGLSPDEQWIYYSQFIDEDKAELYRMRLDGTGKEFLATFDKPYLSIRWLSPESLP